MASEIINKKKAKQTKLRRISNTSEILKNK